MALESHIASIAAGLSKDLRAWVLNPARSPWSVPPCRDGGSPGSGHFLLKRLGIANFEDRLSTKASDLTAFGLELKSYLEAHG